MYVPLLTWACFSLSSVLPDSSQQYDFNMKRNGFRPTSKNAFMTRGEQTMTLAGFRHSHTPPVDPLGSFAITNSAPQGPQAPQAATTTPGTLRGQSIGFGSREGGTGAGLNASGGSSTSHGRPSHLKTRSRSILLAGQSEKYRRKYLVTFWEKRNKHFSIKAIGSNWNWINILVRI